MKSLGMKIGVYVIIAALAIVGAAVVISKVSVGTAVIIALAIIGACNVIDWLSEWLID
ncbi:hypothetical protein MARVELLAND_102 [Bacillus phage vB_BspM_MarvelLand]|nr:hypothetical protein MARVELLAND_102 [Bacillus phage vB_BspM_MarvelLand]